MSHELEKLICPQCGGNDLQPFGNSAYKCQSCGTILKDEPEVKVPETKHYVAPLSSDFTNSIDRKEPVFLNSEERYGDTYEEKTENMDGDSFLKIIIAIGGLIVIGLVVVYLLS